MRNGSEYLTEELSDAHQNVSAWTAGSADTPGASSDVLRAEGPPQKEDDRQNTVLRHSEVMIFGLWAGIRVLGKVYIQQTLHMLDSCWLN